ncbi:MAG: corrinoid protein [Acidobacteriota bacterium]
MEILESISENLISGNDKNVASDTQKALNLELSAETILNDGLIKGMNIVGDRFRDHEIFLPDVLMAAKAMYAGMELIKPILIKSGISSRGKIVIGTMQGDLHDIGKNLVGIMLKGAGYEVIDLGHDVPPEKFVEAAKETGATIIGMSALLTTTMINMKEVINILKRENLQGKIRTIIGGAPISDEYASEIGADKYSFDAGNAVDTVNTLMGK